VNLHQHKGGSDLRVLNIVYVLNQRNQPLMPTTQAKARHLIKKGGAKVIKRFPFTIQLTKATGETKQTITLGVDTGYKHIGLSAVSESKELFSAEVELRTNIVSLLSERRMYRRGRRNKLWYREPRWNNRVSTKQNGWLAPSIQHKVDSHVRLVNKVSKFLPITKVIVEVANFDIQKINNSEITGIEYQNGVQKDFWNIREYVLHRDNHECQHCKKSDLVLQVHHIKSRMVGGGRPDNLITLCKKCHDDYHKDKIKLNIKKLNGFKAETFMSMARYKVVDKLKQNYDNVGITFGYITKSKRIELQLEKSHSNDAFVIADGEHQVQCSTNHIRQKRKNNRCTQLNRSGYKPSIKRCRYNIQPQDLIIVDEKEYISKGTHNKGKSVVCVDRFKNKLDFSTKRIDSVYHVKGFVWNMEVAIPPPPEGGGILAEVG
jgi:N6-L-threonylcarbamoyladenine synthase